MTCQHERPYANASRTSLYAVQDRRYTGEWRTVIDLVDPQEAQQVAALLRASGAKVRIELVDQRLTP
ncbi:MAG: hypothetical protein M3Y27_12105 [Acidobacteriota bacterium]|nr:hypothetical protein [Acidobacteriota bacterium]